MKKQFIYPEILVHDMRRYNILTTSPQGEVVDGDDDFTPDAGAATRMGGLPTAPADQSGWQDLSGFQNGNSGW